MMLELLELCREKEFYCVHNNIEDLIGMAMNTMLPSINLKSQHLDKEKQEVKNIIEHATKHKTRITESLQNLTIIHKMSSNTPKISSVIAITPDLPTEEPEYSLSMGDEHLSTISKTESNEEINSSVENLVPTLSEFEVTSDNESKCDVPVNDESSPIFTTFSNPLFDCNEDFTYGDDKSLSNEDVPMENFKIYSNPLFDDEEIISTKIEEADFDLEEENRLVENFSYDNSSPRSPEELNAEIDDMILESLSPSPIPVENSDSHMEEIDLFLATDELMPPGIENDDYDSEGDIHFLEELLSNYPLLLPENESSNFDHHDDHHFLVLIRNHQMLRSGNKIFDPGIFIEVKSEKFLSQEEFSISFIHDPLYRVFDTLLMISSENEDKVFKHGILSYLFVSHRDKTIFDFS
nr:hypothetical protein [Tanacetum cinerariifolium]